MIAAILLAAGESRRMGSPKALLALEGTTFLGRILETLATAPSPEIGPIRLVLGSRAAEIREASSAVLSRFASRVEVLENPMWRKGQVSSLRVGLEGLEATGALAALVALVDHPLVKPATVARIADAWRASPRSIVIPTHRDRRGHPVVFPRALFPELRTSPDQVGARAVVLAHNMEVLEVPVDHEGIVKDLDTREQYATEVRGPSV
jgi:molybdenum cofactor cytidylyltransferase